MKTALIAGATGLVGKQCLYKLLENPNYDSVYALVRKPLEIKHLKLKQIVFDYQNFAVLDIIWEVTDVYCCLGTTMKKAGTKAAFYEVDFTFVLNLAAYFAKKSTPNFLLISAIGADANSSIFYSKVKGEIETAISKLDYKGIFIFRPSFLMGNRDETRTGEKIGVAVAALVSPLLFGNAKKYRPIHAAKVANGMIERALSGNEGVFVIESDRI
ncbi:MAG: NAD-dependent epimerase/dehydratase family protein [Cytophagales bacterium]